MSDRVPGDSSIEPAPPLPEHVETIPITGEQSPLPGMHTTAIYRHSGPLPDPDTLRQYDAVMPGLAERIVAMAETQASHRQGLERKILDSDVDRARDGQRMAFVLAVAFLVVSAGLIWTGHGVEGTILGTVDLVALVTVFLVGRREESAAQEPPSEPEGK